MDMIVDHIAKCLDQTSYPIVNYYRLDDFLHQYTPFPLSIFVFDERNTELRLVWFHLLVQLFQPTRYRPLYRSIFESLLQQLEDLRHHVPSLVLLSSSVMEIGDPQRERYFQEIVHGHYGRRLHLCRLIDQEERLEAKLQLQLLMESILATFPLDGLTTQTATELLSMYYRNFQSL
jgi:hypothetical protein